MTDQRLPEFLALRNSRMKSTKRNEVVELGCSHSENSNSLHRKVQLGGHLYPHPIDSRNPSKDYPIDDITVQNLELNAIEPDVIENIEVVPPTPGKPLNEEPRAELVMNTAAKVGKSIKISRNRKMNIAHGENYLDEYLIHQRNPFRGDIYIEYMGSLASFLKENLSPFCSFTWKIREKDHITVFTKLRKHVQNLKTALEVSHNKHNISLHYILLINRLLPIINECVEGDEAGKFINVRYLYFRVRRIEKLLKDIYSEKFNQMFEYMLKPQPGSVGSASKRQDHLKHYRVIRKGGTVKKKEPQPPPTIETVHETKGAVSATSQPLLSSEKLESLLKDMKQMIRTRFNSLPKTEREKSYFSTSEVSNGRFENKYAKLLEARDSVELLKKKRKWKQRRRRPSKPEIITKPDAQTVAKGKEVNFSSDDSRAEVQPTETTESKNRHDRKSLEKAVIWKRLH